MAQLPTLVYSVRVPAKVIRKVKADARRSNTSASAIVAAIITRHYAIQEAIKYGQ